MKSNTPCLSSSPSWRSDALQPSVDAPESLRGETSTPQIDSQTLFQGARVVYIRHSGVVYQLRTTKLGKLILTK